MRLHYRGHWLLRRDANFTLVTILWGNVAINVLLTLLAESLLAGVAAFMFSTVVITFIGEIIPQAFFSRHALPVAARLAPLVRFYQFVFWPIARPIGRVLDHWVGPEGIPWFREAELRDVLRYHARSADSEVGRLEAVGAMNFLALDDLPAAHEGEPLDPRSILRLPFEGEHPVFPRFQRAADDPFLRRVDASGKKWAVLVDDAGEPRIVLDAHVFLRGVLLGDSRFRAEAACHRPLVIRDVETTLGHVLPRLTVHPERVGDDVIDHDLILLWTTGEKRIITGADILGRLLRNIARVAYPVAGDGASAAKAMRTQSRIPTGAPEPGPPGHL
jgi:metal transporter CNNM